MGGGGYVAGPVGAAAVPARVPLVLTEADSHLGLTNRLLAPLARRVCLAFPIAGRDGDRYLVTGRPVPPPATDRAAARARFGLATATVRARLRRLAGRALDQRGGGRGLAGAPFRVLHAAGARDYRRAAPAPGERRRPLRPARVPRRRFGEALAGRPTSASPARAARSSRSPPTACPAILVPYPHAAADHQTANARWMAEAGAAVVVPDAELTPARLARRGRRAARRPRTACARWRARRRRWRAPTPRSGSRARCCAPRGADAQALRYARVVGCRGQPELFSAPVLERWLEERRRERLVDVPYFDGLIAGELDALVESFAGEPELHHPVRGRIKGARAFEAFVAETNAWLVERNVSIEDVERVVTERRGFEEVVLHLDGEAGAVDLPVAIVADHRSDGRLDELRIYYSSWPLSGRHANRPPLLQPRPGAARVRRRGRVPARARGRRRRRDRRRPSSRTATPASPRAAGTSTAAPTACAPSTRVCSPTAAASPWSTARSSTTAAPARWSTTSCAGAGRELPPQAGVAVYVRGQSGRLAAARIYDDAEPPPHPAAEL